MKFKVGDAVLVPATVIRVGNVSVQVEIRALYMTKPIVKPDWLIPVESTVAEEQPESLTSWERGIKKIRQGEEVWQRSRSNNG